MREFKVSRLFSVRVTLGLLLAVALTVVWAGTAQAQSAGDQYDTPVSPSGPAAGETATVQSDDGVVGPGDVIIIPGDFVIAEGASVTLQDSDGTQGTLIDGQNAEIVEGSIVITVTDSPIINVAGANGVLNTDGLFVVATTGISAAGDDGDGVDGVADGGAADGDGTDGVADDGTAGDGGADSGAVANAATATAGGGSEAQPASAGIGVLPDTGGPLLLGLLGVVSLLGGGLLAVRRRLSSSE